MTSKRANVIYEDSKRRLIAIESVTFNRSRSDAHFGIQVDIRPEAIVVSGPDENYALDLELGRVSLDWLRQDIPELDAMLERFDIGRSG